MVVKHMVVEYMVVEYMVVEYMVVKYAGPINAWGGGPRSATRALLLCVCVCVCVCVGGQVYRRLGLSKRVFKEAVGHLYRLRVVTLDESGA